MKRVDPKALMSRIEQVEPSLAQLIRGLKSHGIGIARVEVEKDGKRVYAEGKG